MIAVLLLLAPTSIPPVNRALTMWAIERSAGNSGTLPQRLTRLQNYGWAVQSDFEDISDEDDKYLVREEDRNESNERFRSHFSLGESEELVASYYAHIQKAIPIYGKIYVSHNYVCFRSLLPGTRTKMILPVKDIENVSTERGFRFGYSGMVYLLSMATQEYFWVWLEPKSRWCCEHYSQARGPLSNWSSATLPETKVERARLFTYEDAIECNHLMASKYMTSNNVPTEVHELKPLKFVLLTIGSRGDVQPYIALARKVWWRMATRSDFIAQWVPRMGGEIWNRICRNCRRPRWAHENYDRTWNVLDVDLFVMSASKFRSWIDDLLMTSWEACIGADVLIESPSAMAGIHIAEALQIPYFRAFTMPWTRTRAYPHAFIVPGQKMGGSYNYLTYVLFDNVFWKGISGQVNRWRRKTLKIPKTSLDQMRQNRFLSFTVVSLSVLFLRLTLVIGFVLRDIGSLMRVLAILSPRWPGWFYCACQTW